MGNYYIYAVHQEKETIVKVRTCKGYNEVIGPIFDEEKSRDDVIRDIIKGNNVFTLVENPQGNVTKGARVIIEEIGETKYIKTKANNRKEDNLENLEQY